MKRYKILVKNPVMGVPISFLDKYCSEQFEIIGADYDLANPMILGNKKGTGRFYINSNRLYSRIAIRRKVEGESA